jgi:hypothetical protein
MYMKNGKEREKKKIILESKEGPKIWSGNINIYIYFPIHARERLRDKNPGLLPRGKRTRSKYLPVELRSFPLKPLPTASPLF